MKKRQILYIVEDVKSAQFRYRVKNVIEALERSCEWEARFELTGKISKKELDAADLIVILRQTAKDRKILDLIDDIHKCGKKVLFDLDDLIFDYKDLLVLMRGTNSRNIVYWVGYMWGIRRIAKKVDGFITTNNFLGKKLESSFNKPVRVIPNSLDTKQLEIAEVCLKEGKSHDGFIVGYFSGSPTHAKDLQMVEGEMLRFLDAHEDAKFRVTGYVELSKKMQEKLKDGQVETFELVDYLEQMKMMAKVDVNIAPLVINDFTNSKSELKFFEAAVVETTTIASPNYAFKKAIVDFKNGFLAEPNEWYNKLEYVHKHVEENQKIAKNARRYVLDNYYGEKFLKGVEETYEFFG